MRSRIAPPKMSPLQNTLIGRELKRRVAPQLTGPNPQLIPSLKPSVPKLKPPIPRMGHRKF